MENKDIILSGKGITKSYGDNAVLQGISLDLYAGDFTVVMGSSGSGKSTLLYALSGISRMVENSAIRNRISPMLLKKNSQDYGRKILVLYFSALIWSVV